MGYVCMMGVNHERGRGWGFNGVCIICIYGCVNSCEYEGWGMKILFSCLRYGVLYR